MTDEDTAADQHVCVVGAGLGGLRTVEALRNAGHRGPITLIGAEAHAPYDRPPLTKAVLRGDLDSTTLPGDLAELAVTARLGVRATSLDRANRTIHCDDGTEVVYDALVLAPGARPRDLPGTIGLAGVHVLRTIEDALELRAAVRAGAQLTVIGGGFIGCEAAASARHAGAEVDLVEALPAPLYRVLGEAGAQIATELLESRGIRVHAGAAVAQVSGTDAVESVALADGTEIPTAALLVGIGVEPDLAWLRDSGLQIDDGIGCDGSGRTSDPHVWALGDAAAWFHPLAGRQVRIEHWSSVPDQATAVARSILTRSDEPLGTVPYFWSDIFEIKVQAFGFIDPTHDVHVLTPGGRTVIVYSRNGRLTGLVGFAAPQHIIRHRKSVAEGAPVTDVLTALS